MFANQRQEKIYDMVKEKGNVTVEELMNIFNVSIETIRRDLILLESQKCVKRVHGGAISVIAAKRYNKLSKRIDENREKKRELSITAAELVQNGDIISIDSGSTCIEFIEVIKERFTELTILTNSLDVLERLGSIEGFKIHLTGGIYMPEENCLYGENAVKTIKSYCIPKAFIFPFGLTPDKGISDYNIELSCVQKAYIDAAEEKIIMADSSKIGSDAFIRLCDITPDFIIVTDSGVSTEIIEKFEEKGVSVLTGKRE